MTHRTWFAVLTSTLLACAEGVAPSPTAVSGFAATCIEQYGSVGLALSGAR